MKILFATGNKRKLDEAQAACTDFGITVEQVRLEIDEIQHHDPMKITEHKINEAYKFAKKPIVVNDASWNIPSLRGFPGGYMKDVAEWFLPEDFISLMQNKSARKISVTETIAYKDAGGIKFFSQEYWGEVATKPRGNGNSIERVAEFNGETIGERRDKGLFVFDPKDYIWYQFARWLVDKEFSTKK